MMPGTAPQSPAERSPAAASPGSKAASVSPEIREVLHLLDALAARPRG